MTKKFTMLLMSNATENNNKFYEVKLEDDDSVIARYGRVGAQGVVENKGYGESTFDSVIAKKKKKGYREVDILTTNNVATVASSPTTPAQSSLIEVAKRDIARHNPELNHLLERLARINKFQLLAASGGQIDIVDGVVRTPLGLVTLNSVKTAQNKLVSLEEFIKTSHTDDKGYISTLEDYLTLVPQKIPAKRGWHTAFFTEFTSFQKQNELLEQLENSIISSSAAPPTPVADKDTAVKRVFGYSLEKVNDPDVFKRVERYYSSNVNRGHACSHLKLKNLFVISNDEKKTRYQRMLGKVGNEKQLWHGTRAHNVLSILKAGLIIPTSSGGYTITGRMFGDGVYFSDQSSKSLNYAYGYWGGSRENNCFMFLANVAMGKEYVPPRPMQRPPSGYDSMFAIGGKSGVANNEMIVYDLDQTHLAYLCEFDA